jgi:hypothetical protein
MKGFEIMIAQIPTSGTVAAIPSLPVYTHIVTLIHRSSGKEATLTIETFSDRFADVMREVTHQKAEQKLFGFEVFEVLDLNDPFPTSTPWDNPDYTCHTASAAWAAETLGESY